MSKQQINKNNNQFHKCIAVNKSASRSNDNMNFLDLSYTNEHWVYEQILKYTDIPQNIDKSRYAKEKAKSLYTWVNSAATVDAEEGRSMAEITKAIKPVWDAAYDNKQLTKNRYLTYNNWIRTIIATLANATETANYEGPTQKPTKERRRRHKKARRNRRKKA